MGKAPAKPTTSAKAATPTKKTSTTKKPPPDPAAIAAAQKAAKEKLEKKAKEAKEKLEKKKKEEEEKKAKLEQQIKNDQAWLDEAVKGKSESEKKEIFNQLSKNCADTNRKDGNIVLACAIKPKMSYCMPGDKFECAEGKVTGGGCKLSSKVSDGLKKDTKIDGVFVSKEEGGSYLSPYVPWGPISGKDGKPVLTTGNSSGVTIGTGVDLGAIKNTDAYLERLEKAGVSQATRDKIKPFIGKKKEAACQALRDARGDNPLVLDASDVELIDQDAMASRTPDLRASYDKKVKARIAGYDKQIAKLKKAKTPKTAEIAALEEKRDSLREFDDLDGREQSILFSTYYHEGSINSAHSAEFANAAMDGDSAAERAALASKSEDKNNTLVAARGKSELEYWDANPPPVGDYPVLDGLSRQG